MKKKTIVVLPCTGAGHLFPLIELSTRFANLNPNLSFTILLIHPQFPSYVPTIDRSASAVLFPNITFVDLPYVDSTSQHAKYSSGSLIRNARYYDSQEPAVFSILNSLISSSTTVVSAFIVDMFCATMIKTSQSLKIPTYVFVATGASFLSLWLLIRDNLDGDSCKSINSDDLIDLKEDIEIPGMSIPLQPSDLPIIFQRKTDPVYPWLLDIARLFSSIDGFLINTFEELEPGSLQKLRNQNGEITSPSAPQIYPLGPIVAQDNNLYNQPSNFECLRWLDHQPDSSVIFLCFGSMGGFNDHQIHEIAHGLELSKHRFLWSVRLRMGKVLELSCPGDPDLEKALPEGFRERTTEYGLVISGWVPQLGILSHLAVGGFVSHCGWNSIIESLWYGVPIIAWPLYSEQKLNKVLLVDELGLGLGLKMREEEEVAVRGEELGRVIKSLMDGDEEGERVRMKTKRIMELGRRALMEDGGSSYVHLHSLVKEWSCF